MNPAFVRASFEKSKVPQWTCPTCEKGTLTPVDEFTIKPNAETTQNQDEEWFDSDYAGYVFNGMLNCGACKENVIICGTGHVIQDYEDNGPGWDYFTMLTPTFFIPPLKVISPSVNDQVPDQVTLLLNKAHEICWSDPDSALNRLRSIVEEVLDYKGVPRTMANGNRRSLHNRIELFTEPGTEQVKAALLALKYVGNDGSHGFSGIKRKDLLDVFSIVKFCLEKLFPVAIDDSAVLAAVTRINANQGLRPRVEEPRGGPA